jgi:hypothetical protein
VKLKNWLLLILLPLGCDDASDCARAVAHIQECTGAASDVTHCTPETARWVVDQPCAALVHAGSSPADGWGCPTASWLPWCGLDGPIVATVRGRLWYLLTPGAQPLAQPLTGQPVPCGDYLCVPFAQTNILGNVARPWMFDDGSEMTTGGDGSFVLQFHSIGQAAVVVAVGTLACPGRSSAVYVDVTAGDQAQDFLLVPGSGCFRSDTLYLYP